MKKTAGFTLIELVIVIVILGILGAVAAPKFINLQGDAYGANVNALKGSLQSAATLGSTKAILAGLDSTEGNVNIDGTNVAFVNGSPAATKAGILAMLQEDVLTLEASYTIVEGGGSAPLTLTPTARIGKKCRVEYTENFKGAATGGGDGKDEAIPANSLLVKAITTEC